MFATLICGAFLVTAHAKVWEMGLQQKQGTLEVATFNDRHFVGAQTTAAMSAEEGNLRVAAKGKTKPKPKPEPSAAWISLELYDNADCTGTPLFAGADKINTCRMSTTFYGEVISSMYQASLPGEPFFVRELVFAGGYCEGSPINIEELGTAFDFTDYGECSDGFRAGYGTESPITSSSYSYVEVISNNYADCANNNPITYFAARDWFCSEGTSVCFFNHYFYFFDYDDIEAEDVAPTSVTVDAELEFYKLYCNAVIF